MKYIKLIGCFYFFVLQRFFRQRCTEIASSLSYTSLLSLVPLMAVFFAGFSSFSVFQELFQEVQHFVFANFVPSSSEVIQDYLEQFVGKASKLTLVGLISLFVIALMLMWQIDKAFNQIWGVKKSKNIMRTFLTYWATLTLGPLFIGISLMVTSYITSLPLITGAADSIGYRAEILSLVPMVLTLCAFTLINVIVPNTRVTVFHAFVGGMTSTILFELAKKSFALYISYNTTYSSLYGALATLPIFLIWIYISWLVTLLGVMTARSMSLFDFTMSDQKYSSNQFLAAFHVLRILSRASQNGQSLNEKQIFNESMLRSTKNLDSILNELESLDWIRKTENEQWAQAKDLDSVTLWQLYKELPYSLPKYVTEEPLSSIIGQSNKLLAKELDTPIKSLFARYD